MLNNSKFKNYKCVFLVLVTLAAGYIYDDISHHEYPTTHDSYEKFELSIEILHSNNSSWELWIPTPLAMYENFSDGRVKYTFEISPVVQNLVERENNISIKLWNESTMLVITGEGDLDMTKFLELRNFSGYLGFIPKVSGINDLLAPYDSTPQFIFNSSNGSVASLVWTYSSKDCPFDSQYPDTQIYFDEKLNHGLGKSGSIFDLETGITPVQSHVYPRTSC